MGEGEKEKKWGIFRILGVRNRTNGKILDSALKETNKQKKTLLLRNLAPSTLLSQRYSCQEEALSL